MRDLGCIEWFDDWLVYHQRVNPSRLWPDIETPDGVDFFEGWIEEFNRIRATLPTARAASRKLQAGPRLLPYEQLPALARHISELLKAGLPQGGMTPEQELRSARAKSMDCPECHGAGLAKRPVLIAGPPERRWGASLYCRCPFGRLLLRGDWEAVQGELEKDDLQARPELWDLELSHPTWSSTPEPALVTILGPDSAVGRYLRPEEKTGLRDRPPRPPGDRPNRHRRSLMSDCTRRSNP